VALATIIVPTYNEAENIPHLVDRIRKCLDSTLSYDILIMDDSPTSDTVKVAQWYKCETVYRTTNKGLSPAVIEGINIAITKGSDYIVVMDADLQHPPEVLPRLLEALKEHDFVIPSRYVKGGGCREWGSDRKLISRVANLMAAPLTMFKVKDLASGFFGFRTSSLKSTDHLKAKGFKVMLELLVKNQWSSIVEIPYIFENREHGKSKLGKSQVVAYVKQLIDLYLHKFKWIRFGMVGGFGTILKLATMYTCVEVLGLHYMVAYAISFVVAVSSNYTWNSLWTFKQRGSTRGFGSYIGISLISLTLNEGVIFLLTGVLGVWYMTSTVIAILIAFTLNYTLSRRLVWKR